MIPLELARQLKEAGLVWKPKMLDMFGVPERGMDQRRFVISDMMTNIEHLFGSAVVAFQGASEWALDYLVTTEAVWLPSETQLRQLLEQHLAGEGQSHLTLSSQSGHYSLQVKFKDESLAFENQDAILAYASALLHMLKNYPQPDGITLGEDGVSNTEEAVNYEDIWEQSLGED